MEFELDGLPLVSTEVLAKIRSFCQRNKNPPALLTAPVEPTTTIATGVDSDNATLSDNEHRAFSDPGVNLRLRPNAYFAARHMEGANGMILRDLIRLGDLVGKPKTKNTASNSLGKRKC